MAAQGAFGTDFYDWSILRPKHCAYYRSGRPVIEIGPKGALGSHEIRPIHSAPSLGQSIARNKLCPNAQNTKAMILSSRPVPIDSICNVAKETVLNGNTLCGAEKT